MGSALSLVWVAPGGHEAGGSSEKDTSREGNGEAGVSTVLVVEDDVLIRMAVSDYLRGCGYRVIEASSGEEAQTIFRTGEPVEVLFSDVNIAGEMNGFALARWVREHFPDVRIILTSGVARIAERATELCEEVFLTKPYSYESLADHIKRLLGAFARSA
jgi:CheY-like chemotaxis protein